jgi:hypothetical protein
MLGFVTEQIALVGLGDDDMALIRRTVPLVPAHEAALTSALYDHLLAFPATAHFFQPEDGSPDLARIERRKHSLARWLKETAERVVDINSLRALASPSLHPRSQAVRPPGPHAAAPLEPQTQHRVARRTYLHFVFNTGRYRASRRK